MHVFSVKFKYIRDVDSEDHRSSLFKWPPWICLTAIKYIRSLIIALSVYLLEQKKLEPELSPRTFWKKNPELWCKKPKHLKANKKKCNPPPPIRIGLTVGFLCRAYAIIYVLCLPSGIPPITHFNVPCSTSVQQTVWYMVWARAMEDNILNPWLLKS